MFSLAMLQNYYYFCIVKARKDVQGYALLCLENSMETYITCLISEELEHLNQYLATQDKDLHVSIDSPIPADRYIIPDSLTLIVQHIQRHNLYPLHIRICFLSHTVEVSYHLQPRPVPDDTYHDIETLVELYRNYFNLPTIRQADDYCTISISLFI